jgi:hypothetical protein
LKNFPLDLAPVARVMAVLQAKLAQAEPLTRPQFFNEYSKHTFYLNPWYNIYHSWQSVSNKNFRSGF